MYSPAFFVITKLFSDIENTGIIPKGEITGNNKNYPTPGHTRYQI